MTDPRILAFLSDRERLKRCLPAMIDAMDGQLPLHLDTAVRAWLEQVEDARFYAAGMGQKAIAEQRVPRISKQRVEQRIKAFARHVLERHPELLEGGDE